MYEIVGNENLEIAAFQFSPYESRLSMCTLYVDGERPIYYNNSMIFFFSIENAPRALSLSNCGAKQIKEIPDKIDYCFDFGTVIRILEDFSISSVSDAMMLDCLDMLGDYCFDTMDFWTPEKKERDKIQKNRPPSDTEEYMVPIDWNTDIRDDCDFVRQILSASAHFLAYKEIEPHFLEKEYNRKDLVVTMKYLIGDIVTSAMYVG